MFYLKHINKKRKAREENRDGFTKRCLNNESTEKCESKSHKYVFIVKKITAPPTLKS